ncbi:hypothetical protein DRP77_06170, partial [Candidatus Poribacteria bacterium]
DLGKLEGPLPASNAASAPGIDPSAFPEGVELLPRPVRRFKREFYACRTKYFLIYFAPEHQDVAAKAAGEVDRIYERLSKWFGLELRTPYRIFLLPDKRTIYRATGEMRDIGGAVTSTRGTLYIAAQYYNRRVVTHELSHIFLRKKVREKRVPVWFNEGLAEYLSTRNPTSPQLMGFVRRKLSRRRLYSWRELERQGIMLRDPEVTYLEALSAVVFLSARFGEDKIKKLLELYGGRGYSKPFEGAVQEVFGVSVAQLEAEWRDFLWGEGDEGRADR